VALEDHDAVFDDQVAIDNAPVEEVATLLAYDAVVATKFKAWHVGALLIEVSLIESTNRLQYPRACMPPPIFNFNSDEIFEPISTLPLNITRICS
jgi:hypothetical protein